VAIARLAGADKFATETYDKAQRLLTDSESARARGLSANEIMMPARQAVQTAEDARLIGLQRQEEAYQANLRAAAAGRERESSERAQAEAARRRQAELATQTANAAQGAAERGRTDAERNQATAERGQANAE